MPISPERYPETHKMLLKYAINPINWDNFLRGASPA